jgi:small-conductance mechanosensitive channel
MDFQLTSWPTLDRWIWTAVTIAAAFVIGLLINRIVIARLQKLAARTSGDWDDAVILELRRRIPFWAFLGGVRVSAVYWPLQPDTIDNISKLITAVAVLSVTSAIAGISVRLITALGPRRNQEMKISGLMRNVVRLTIFTIGVLVALRGIGVEITPVLAALGVGGLAVALALRDPLSNLFAGVFIALAGQVRIGDYIKLEAGPEGTVADFSWNATQLATAAGNLVIVPNHKLADALITNYHRPSRDTALALELTVAPESDLAVVERVSLDVGSAVMRDVAGGMPAVEPTVRFLAYTDLGIRVGVNVRTQHFADQALVRHELIKRLQTALTGAGVTVATTGKGDEKPATA